MGIFLMFLWIAVGLSIWFQGLRKIPADPPCVALITFFGKPIPEYKEAGWRFFFLYPFIFGYILIDVSKKNSTEKEISSQLVRAPDFAEFLVPLEITWTPMKDGQALIEYIKSKKEKGVWEILAGIVAQRLREWAISSIEGPQDGEALLKAGDDAVAILIKAIAGNALSPIPGPFPTQILLHYFKVPRPSVRPEEKKIAGKNWEKLEEELRKLPPGLVTTIKTEVEKRRDGINDIRNGNGKQAISHLGIELKRLNIGEIKATGKYGESLESKAKEERERKSETLEIQHVADTVDRLKKQLGVSNETALEILQTERGKVTKSISENKWNISPETRAMIEKIAPEILAGFLKKFTKGGK
ncbi:MAG: hypothetical protein Q8N22_02365 [bacterium]|nr:hypothetical protein [bacterium]